MKKYKLLLAVITPLAIVTIALSFWPKIIHINSIDIKKATERVEKLQKEVPVPSKILDAEYDLFNSYGLEGLDITPHIGPSDVSYRFVVKVNPENISKWIHDFIEIPGDPKKEKWMNALIEKRKENWITTTAPKFYIHKNAENFMIIVFLEEGIIYESFVQN